MTDEQFKKATEIKCHIRFLENSSEIAEEYLLCTEMMLNPQFVDRDKYNAARKTEIERLKKELAEL